MPIEANRYAVCCHNNAFDNDRVNCTKNCDCGSPCKDHAYFDPKGLCVETLNKKLATLLRLLQEHRHVQNVFASFTSKAQIPYEVPGSIVMVENPDSIKWDENA